MALLARCPSCRRAVPRDLASLGDAAAEEGAVGAFRADVLVLAAGAPALALEARVTHALEPEKEAALAASGIPAVEIDAREAWERERDGGVEIVASRSVGFAPCTSCEALARAERDRARGGEAAEIAELERYRPLFRAAPLRGAPAGRPGVRAESPLSAAEREGLARSFRCPDCGGRDLQLGERIARHLCARAPARAVAWRGYDGALVTLSWWRSDRSRSGT